MRFLSAVCVLGLPVGARRLCMVWLVAGAFCAMPAVVGCPTETVGPPKLIQPPELGKLDAGSPPPLTRLPIRLGGPVPVNANGALTTVGFRADVVVPDGIPMGGAVLVLSGVFGTATVTWDGVVIATVQAGHGPNELDLSDKMSVGKHSVDISLTRAGVPPPILLGGDRQATPMLVDPPILLLRPAAHVSRIAVPVSGGNVTATAVVKGAPDGATVRFLAALDGAVVADLGKAAVVDGVATAPAIPLTIPQWKMLSPALYNVFAILEAADGSLLDAYGTRMGPREVKVNDTGFDIGEVPARIVGWRSGPRPFTPADFGPLIRTGGNAFEYHGSPPTEHQMDVFDETGVGVVLTPRCEGTFNVIPAAEREPLITNNLALILDQTVRSAWDFARHPSAIVWVSESITLTALGQVIADADPEHRPIVNKDIRQENVTLGRETAKANYAGAWVGETAWEGPPGDINVTLTAFGQALREGVRGGIMEHVEDPAREVAWAPLLTEQKIAPIQVNGRRGESRVVMAGTTPGAVAWVEAPWLPPEAVLSTSTEVSVSAWHAGPATAVVGETRHPVELAPLVWSEAGLTGEVSRVPAAPK